MSVLSNSALDKTKRYCIHHGKDLLKKGAVGFAFMHVASFSAATLYPDFFLEDHLEQKNTLGICSAAFVERVESPWKMVLPLYLSCEFMPASGGLYLMRHVKRQAEDLKMPARFVHPDPMPIG